MKTINSAPLPSCGEGGHTELFTHHSQQLDHPRGAGASHSDVALGGRALEAAQGVLESHLRQLQLLSLLRVIAGRFLEPAHA
eukprot:CAMPEP_0206175558 /NCGR_PEP_ID=MMETSP1474-20131121/55294_1 /ASSEMBLY_ACC=CAM_ASM_001110 /TAXON_ID=97495 /ORGANISM="Imantonia sp., Strain RCC918" /LENGTH=81 /DNA_ID=CAMNT_0053585865 /DNA_START=6 /DNA_END=247 /DNA_ORIENTATION=-